MACKWLVTVQDSKNEIVVNRKEFSEYGKAKKEYNKEKELIGLGYKVFINKL